jgi:hypothetical protein
MPLFSYFQHCDSFIFRRWFSFHTPPDGSFHRLYITSSFQLHFFSDTGQISHFLRHIATLRWPIRHLVDILLYIEIAGHSHVFATFIISFIREADNAPPLLAFHAG